ncbi:MAG TPA: glutamine amidotransferase [Stenotrophomonas sp.]|jgi:GMP synthase (glutamine-hydrolysing)
MHSKSATAIRHSAVDGMGTIRSLLESRGYRTSYRDAAAGRIRSIDPLDVDMLVVLGGPLHAHDMERHLFLQEEIDLIRIRCHYGLPTLGISLGAQLISYAIGGEVRAMAQPEIGIAPVVLTEQGRRSCLMPLGSGAPVLHWHSDEIVLPPGVSSLAATPRSQAQAFMYGSSTLALQFHLETDVEQIGTRIHRCRRELEEAGIDLDRFRRQAREEAQHLRHACHAVMTRWLDEIDGLPNDDTHGIPLRATF